VVTAAAFYQDYNETVLKKIPSEQLCVGMYLARINDDWLDTPFWRSSFLLTKESDIQKLIDHGYPFVWIDTVKGRDVTEASQPPASDTEQPAQETGSAESFSFGEALPVSPNEPRPAPLEVERARAAVICAKARREVMFMFQELRMGKAVDADKMLPVVDEISQSILRNSDALIGLVRLKTKNDYTYMHSVAVCALMVALARQLGMNEAQARDAGMAGLLHDIGKMAVPEAILDKPGALTDAEFQVIKSHPVAGHRILSEGRGVPEAALDVVLHHHEKIDGSGYPHGLSKDDISPIARMGAVCDVYDAITSHRPYKQGWCPNEALRRMASWKGHFDPDVFQAFVKSIGIYPVGTLVRLESGRLGVVLQQMEKSLLQPRVKVFFSTKSMTHIPPKVIDLALGTVRDKIVDREDPAKWDFKDLDAMWVHA
jgi:putative nucleotidyltransferase with HDIG domain